MVPSKKMPPVLQADLRSRFSKVNSGFVQGDTVHILLAVGSLALSGLIMTMVWVTNRIG